jgi:hypothetical protein
MDWLPCLISLPHTASHVASLSGSSHAASEFSILHHVLHPSEAVKEMLRLPHRNRSALALGTLKAEYGGHSSSCLPIIISLTTQALLIWKKEQTDDG